MLSALAILGLAAGCGRAERGESLRPISDAARIEVFVHQGTPLGRRLDERYGDASVAWCAGRSAAWCSHKLAGSVDDARAVGALSRFANERLHGWGTPMAGAPVPDVDARFYNARGEVVGTLGSGQGFFTRGPASTLSRPASDEELGAYLSLLGLEPAAVR